MSEILIFAAGAIVGALLTAISLRWIAADSMEAIWRQVDNNEWVKKANYRRPY